MSSVDASQYDSHGHKREAAHPAPNNPGARLMLIVLIVVAAVGLLVGPTALGKLREQATCVTASQQPSTCR